MNSKSLLMAIAALTLTVTNARAFNEQMLTRANLTEEERHAFTIARELQIKGDVEAAKEVLVDAGIDEFVLERLRLSMSEYQSSREEIYQLPGTTTENTTANFSFDTDVGQA